MRGKIHAIFIGVAIASQLSAATLAHATSEFEKALLKRQAYVEILDRTAPPFTLRDADGRVASLEDDRGKVVVLWFAHTSCPDVCPPI